MQPNEVMHFTERLQGRTDLSYFFGNNDINSIGDDYSERKTPRHGPFLSGAFFNFQSRPFGVRRYSSRLAAINCLIIP
jgi:hypothetical protein